MNLYLIGYRGCGKSTVAPLVASQLGWQVVDTDDQVEFIWQMTIAEIFAELGELEFRHREGDVVAGLAMRSGIVGSLGGGALVSEANREWIAQSGKTIWLQADPDTLWQRISDDAASDTQRPDLTSSGGKAEVGRVLATRCPVYEACSDYSIDVVDLSPEEITTQIVDWWNSADCKR